MNQKNHGAKLIFRAELLSMILFAASFLVMPKASSMSLNQEKNGLLFFTGAWFWIALALTIVLFVLLTVRRKRAQREKAASGRPALFRVFSNMPAKIADILFLPSIIAFLITLIFTDGYLIFVFLFLSVLFFQLHLAFNGKNYAYVKSLGTEELAV